MRSLLNPVFKPHFNDASHHPSSLTHSYFCPSIFLPTIFLPSIFLPSIFLPSIFLPSIFLPSIFLPIFLLPPAFSAGSFCRVKQKKTPVISGVFRDSSVLSYDQNFYLQNGFDRLNDPSQNLVWIGLGVRTTIFEVALIATVDEAVRNSNRRSTVSHAIAELVDRLGLVQTC